jgi:hypothetical protein
MITCNELYDLIKNLNSGDDYTKKYEELIKLYNDAIDKIDLIFYDLYKYEYTKITETIEEREKRLDSEFRNKVREKYKTCMITNKPLYVSQVAHIYPFKLCEPDEKYDISNGLLLSAELHLLFDTPDHKLIINPDTKIISFSEDILNDKSMIEYRQYQNMKIDLDEKNIYYLRKKYVVNK